MTATTDTAARAFVNRAVADPDDRTNLLVAADWYREVQGDVLREEWCRCTVDVAQASPCAWVDAGGPSCERWIADGEKGRCTACHATRHLTARLRDLEAALAPAWPCRCRKVPRYAHESNDCPTCGGSGDVLRAVRERHHGAAGYETHTRFPLTWAAGHVAGVTLPRLVDAVDRCGRCGGDGWMYTGPGGGQRSQETCGDCRGSGWRASPRLRALCSPPPWGVPLAWVFVGDREPEKSGSVWMWHNTDDPTDRSDIPLPIFQRVAGYFHTPDAARRALAAAICAFGRK